MKPYDVGFYFSEITYRFSVIFYGNLFNVFDHSLLKDVLRDDMGFKGVVVSDWGAYRVAYKSLKATLDLVMPHDEKHFANLKDAYEKGLITEEEIDASVERILKLIEFCKSEEKKVSATKEQRHENAVKIAEEGIVLLKNEGALPLKGGKISIAGGLAITPPIGGGGSALAETEYSQQDLTELLQKELGEKADAAFVKEFMLDKHFSLGLKKP